MNKCLFCGSDVNNKYCSISCQNKHQSKIRNDKKYGVFKDFKVNCTTCGKEIIINEREKLFPKKEKYYCSRSCSNKRVMSEQNKILLSKKFSKIREINCDFCGLVFKQTKTKQRFCSKSCATKHNLPLKGHERSGGLASAQSQNKRSKNEIYFAELCEKEFKVVYFNEKMFNGWDADIIIDDYKLAILWNGVWHYKQITKKHSLEQVQNRDKIKINEIIKLEYEPYIIKDLGKFNKEFVELEFDKLKKNILRGGVIGNILGS